MKKLVEALRGVYDMFDRSAAFTPVVDVRSTINCRFLSLVIEWGATSVETVESALSSAPLVYENLWVSFSTS